MSLDYGNITKFFSVDPLATREIPQCPCIPFPFFIFYILYFIFFML